MIGKLYPKHTILMVVAQGDATQGENKYKLCSTLNGNPVIYSEQSQRYFSVSWEEILQLAVEAGINNVE